MSFAISKELHPRWKRKVKNVSEKVARASAMLG